MADHPPSPAIEASNSNGVPEPAVEALPQIPPPPYQESIAVGTGNTSSAQTYPPQQIPDPENAQEELPSYNQHHDNYQDSLVLLLFSGIPPFAYELFLKNGVNSPFKLTGARILNILGWAIGITTAVLGLRNQAISSFALVVMLAALWLCLYLLEKYKEDCREFAPWLFEEDYKFNVLHGGVWAVQLPPSAIVVPALYDDDACSRGLRQYARHEKEA
ncbi:hypothetical protein FRC01_001914 [Tulasnella sp. 417]|nr:hypothetical protein FRC01_001914 [Tulasnella sp. 417]